MTTRLPIPGSDDNTWGAILNAYLQVSHSTDGTLQPDAIVQAGAVTVVNDMTPTSGSITLHVADIADVSGGTTATDNQVLAYDSSTNTWGPSTVSTTPISEATTTTKGVVQLAGDLAGIATSPTVAKVNGIAITGVPSANQVLTATGATAAAWSNPASGSVQTFVATANGVMDTNVYCAPGSSNVSSTAGLYTQALVGLTAVFIQGGSGGTTDLVTTVTSVTDSNHLTLATTVPGATGNAQTLIIGSDISTALRTAIAAAATANEPLFMPAVTYIKTSPTTVPSNVVITGAGRQETTIIHASSTTSAFVGTDMTSVIFSDWTVLGPGQGVGTGSGVSFTLLHNPATYYPTFARFSASKFGVDGIALETPIVGRFEQVVPENNGRHGFNLSGAGQADGTSCSFVACFPAGNWAAGYYLNQMAYTSLSGCAADANGVGYYYATCIGITESGCGSEETYNFNLLGRTSFTPNGLSRYISNSKVVMNSPYMIQNVGTACYITNTAKVVINDYYEGSPGNSDDPNSNPTASLKVDSGCTVVVNNYANVTAMSLASGSTALLPDALQTSSTASQQASLSSDQSLAASSSNTLLSLTLTTGKWLITSTVTLQQGTAAGNTDIRIVAGTATIAGGTAATIRAASASQPATGALTAVITVTAAGTVCLNAYPVAATTAKSTTTANTIPNATSIQAVPLLA